MTNKTPPHARHRSPWPHDATAAVILLAVALTRLVARSDAQASEHDRDRVSGLA